MTDTGRDAEVREMWDSVDDAALARGMRVSADDATNSAAWNEFGRRHLGSIKSFIEVKARDLGADVCEDLIAEAVVRIQRGVDKYVNRGPGTFRSWCLKIADRVMLDAWRGRLDFVPVGSPATLELVSFDEITERYAAGEISGDSDEATGLMVHGPDHEPRALTEREEAMREAFDSLSSIDQAVVWCRIEHGDSDKDVAAITGKPVDHVRKIRDKAMKKLVKAFDRRMAVRRQAS